MTSRGLIPAKEGSDTHIAWSIISGKEAFELGEFGIMSFGNEIKWEARGRPRPDVRTVRTVPTGFKIKVN